MKYANMDEIIKLLCGFRRFSSTGFDSKGKGCEFNRQSEEIKVFYILALFSSDNSV